MQDIDIEGALLTGQLHLTIRMGNETAPVTEGNVSYSLDGGPFKNFEQQEPGKFFTIVDITELDPGPHNITIVSIDAAGNIARRTYNFTADPRPPEMRAGKAEFDQYWNLHLPVNITDPYLNTTSVMYQIGKAAWVTVDVPENATSVDLVLTIPESELTVGTHNFTITAKDLAGNQNTTVVRLTIVAHPNPCTGCKAEFKPDGSVAISWVAPGGNVNEFHIYHSTSPILDIKSMTNYQSTTDPNLTLSGLDPGTHYFAVAAVFNGIESAPCFFMVDVPAPNMSLVSMNTPAAVPKEPTEGDDVDVNATITNKGKAPAELTAKLFVDGEEVDSVDIDVRGDSDEPINLKWEEATDGDHRLEVKVYQRGSVNHFISKYAQPDPLTVKKGPSFLEGLLTDTPLEPMVPVVKAAGSDFVCCMILIIILAAIVGTIYIVMSSRRKRSPDEDIAEAMAKDKVKAPAEGEAYHPAYPKAPKKAFPSAPKEKEVIPGGEAPVLAVIDERGAKPVPAEPKPEPTPPPTPEARPEPMPPAPPTPPPEVPPVTQPPAPPTVEEPTEPPAEAPAPAVPEAAAPLIEKMDDLKARARRASMDSLSAVSHANSATTRAEAEAAAGKALFAREKAESALKELEEIAAQATEAGAGEKVEEARNSINKNIEKIKRHAEKAFKAAEEKGQ
jgi:hypothetical protein